ncbi:MULTISPECIES: STY0301 family protein [unclassified Pseudomonas]|uniref:STY0301 family protein n=1 Tax=unclassified Pseudomonas TaxID=196821 RepID=UPI002449135C|nr:MULTISPECIES: STY0301 family protein [unclassified Pseudomonas]MDG9924903.1 hypothetical protein [Pseudomonas sp. GD04045]MDH0036184.1 hypothetical protein [Pseudomonas sp. GD04019]
MRTALFAIGLLSASPLLAQDFVCPASPQSASADWQAFPIATSQPPSRAQAERIELYGGDPRLGARAIADDASGQVGVAPLTWTLAGQPLFMVCIYAGSERRLMRALPAGLSHCRANNEFEDLHLQLECR